jgi:hypothetical protein
VRVHTSLSVGLRLNDEFCLVFIVIMHACEQIEKH